MISKCTTGFGIVPLSFRELDRPRRRNSSHARRERSFRRSAKWLGGERERQPEPRKERGRVEKRIQPDDRAVRDLEDHERPGLVAPARTMSEPQVERSELQALIQQSIDSLPPAQRMTVILYYLNDLSLKEIAYILDCPIGTVKSRLYYGREQLKASLEDYRSTPHLKPAPQRG